MKQKELLKIIEEFVTCVEEYRQTGYMSGWDKPLKQAKKVLKLNESTPEPIGNIHTWTGPTGKEFTEIKHESGTYYRAGTPKPVIDALESARKSGAKIRLHYGDSQTGKDWMDDQDVEGYIGRTSGPLKVPILLTRKRSTGGTAILLDNIVKLSVSGNVVYQHPKFNQPEFTSRPVTDEELKDEGYSIEILADNKVHARFKTQKVAEKWLEFMKE